MLFNVKNTTPLFFWHVSSQVCVLGTLKSRCFQSNNQCNACSLVFAHMVRYTSCRAFLMTLNELNDYAGQHEVIAENLSTQIISELVRYIQELKAERKAVCALKL